jgi:tungstate transport system substrate-binding protein
MRQTLAFPPRVARLGNSRRRGGAPRRLLRPAALGLLTAAALLLTPALASADSASTLTVVGTSDVSDSGLMSNVIQPDFQKAYPQFTFKYIGTATGTAISDAESGSVGASALIVHAASLENQFVANGFSAERFGRAIFTNDFVLGGPSGDPAGVSANGAHNIAQALADVATAGISGRATFVSRGGTPGTTVEEHQIWALVAGLASPPAGLLLCAVNATNGGGDTPIAAGNGVTASGQPCPNGGALPTALPSWYKATGLTQGPNVIAANACNFPTGANTCYVLTDRGTYDFLASGTDPAGSIPNLSILTRGPQSASAPGGADALVNYFHAYIVNPSKPGETVNLTAAQDFLNLITSPLVQAQLKGYLPSADPGGPPFVADASPILTASGLPRTYHAGKPLTVTGTVTNAQPGYPPIAFKNVTLDEIEGGVPVALATGRTKADATYSIRFTPTSTGSYELSTGQIIQIENATLNPVFGDLLSPAATSPVAVTVQSAITKLVTRSAGGKALVFGSVAPGTGHVKGIVRVLARAVGSKKGFRTIATDRLSASDGNFAIIAALAARGWQIKVNFQDARQVLGSASPTVRLTVGPKPASSVSLRSLTDNRGTLTLAGAVRPAAPTAGAKIELLGLNTQSGSAHFSVLAKASIRRGRTKFTLRTKQKLGSRWVLQLEYVQKGRPSSFSSLRTVNVH